MNHQFEIITTPKYIIDYLYDLILRDKTQQCKICGIIMTNNDDFDPCNYFFLNGKEIYHMYFNIKELNENVKLTCEKFIIKNILE